MRIIQSPLVPFVEGRVGSFLYPLWGDFLQNLLQKWLGSSQGTLATVKPKN